MVCLHPLLQSTPAIVASPKLRLNTFNGLRRRRGLSASASTSKGGDLRLEEQVPKTKEKEKELNRPELDLERERESERNEEGGGEIELSSNAGVGTDILKERSGREIFRRSHLLAQQVIAVESAFFGIRLPRTSECLWQAGGH